LVVYLNIIKEGNQLKVLLQTC